MPMKQAAADVQAALNGTSINDFKTRFFNQPPDWFAPPSASDMFPFSSNMTDVVLVNSTGVLQMNLTDLGLGRLNDLGR